MKITIYYKSGVIQEIKTNEYRKEKRHYVFKYLGMTMRVPVENVEKVEVKE